MGNLVSAFRNHELQPDHTLKILTERSLRERARSLGIIHPLTSESRTTHVNGLTTITRWEWSYATS